MNSDPFFGYVPYLKKEEINRYKNPMLSLDGMLKDIKWHCQEIMKLISIDPIDDIEIEAHVRHIVMCFQGVCYLRLHESIYHQSPDKLFFGLITPLDENHVDKYVSIGDMWGYLFDAVEKVAGRFNESVTGMELLGCDMNYVLDICEMYQGILTLRRH